MNLQKVYQDNFFWIGNHPDRVYELYKGKKDDQLLHRSQLYFKAIPLIEMKGALRGYPCTFKEGYEMFRKMYKIVKIK